MSKLPTGTLGLAAEYAVASELCRLGIYTQLTLGNLKRTDLLTVSDSGRMAKIEVKAKQGKVWPACKGIRGTKHFLVFVDYSMRESTDRPDFYVLSARDWRRVADARIREIRKKKPEKRVTISEDHVVVFPDEITRSGSPYRGISISPEDISAFLDAWRKIARSVGITIRA